MPMAINLGLKNPAVFIGLKALVIFDRNGGAVAFQDSSLGIKQFVK